MGAAAVETGAAAREAAGLPNKHHRASAQQVSQATKKKNLGAAAREAAGLPNKHHRASAQQVSQATKKTNLGAAARESLSIKLWRVPNLHTKLPSKAA
jgi:hypothetical protein